MLSNSFVRTFLASVLLISLVCVSPGVLLLSLVSVATKLCRTVDHSIVVLLVYMQQIDHCRVHRMTVPVIVDVHACMWGCDRCADRCACLHASLAYVYVRTRGVATVTFNSYCPWMSLAVYSTILTLQCMCSYIRTYVL